MGDAACGEQVRFARESRTRSSALVLCGAVLACSAAIDEAGENRSGSRTLQEAGYAEQEAAGFSDTPAPATRFARLTHLQWKNAVEDLFGLDDAEKYVTFRSDPSQQGFLFDRDASTLEVDQVLWREYQRAASAIAERVTQDPSLFSRIVPADTGDPASRVRRFIAGFGLKVHRRPLSSAETDQYLALYDAARGAYPGMTDFDSGIRLLLEAFLQSPHFVYRVERSTERAGTVVPLDPYEVASRLSFMLWDSMPDQALLDAAKSGALSRADLAAEQAARMLEDDRARAVVGSFHAQLLDVERYKSIQPSKTSYPAVSDSLAHDAEQETRRFVVSTVFEKAGSFADLLTSNETFVNRELASIYGLSGSYGAEFVPATLNPNQRRGFLTQVGFLASNASSVDPDPIHRGVFVAKRIACMPIGVPPGEIPPLPPPMGRTNRETVQDHTEKEGTACSNCHAAIINPLGFPFEHYDAVGAYRTEDNGHPVDAAATPSIGGQSLAVANALDLADALAGSPAVHECYARHWLEFAYGRAETAADSNLIQRLGKASADGTLSVKALILGLIKTEAFMTRSSKELQ